jgi:hypothetical protein
MLADLQTACLAISTFTSVGRAGDVVVPSECFTIADGFAADFERD